MWNLDEAGLSSDSATVAVIIPTYNQARFLDEAISSVLAQTRAVDDIIVVDDGSTDDPAKVVARFERVRIIRQNNRGPSATRNTGLRNCKTDYIVFLDADDRLLPRAIESGLGCIANHPDCAFVYGGYHIISEDGGSAGPDRVDPIEGDAHLAFLRGSPITVPSMVLHRRDRLLEMNGFDETLRRAEDRDLYLRITQKYPIASHTEIIAEYRRHDKNATNNYLEQLKGVLRLLDLYEARVLTNSATRAALREGRTSRRNYFASQMLTTAAEHWSARHEIKTAATNLIQAVRWSPHYTIRRLFGALGRRASKVLRRPFVPWRERTRGRP